MIKRLDERYEEGRNCIPYTSLGHRDHATAKSVISPDLTNCQLLEAIHMAMHKEIARQLWKMAKNIFEWW